MSGVSARALLDAHEVGLLDIDGRLVAISRLVFTNWQSQGIRSRILLPQVTVRSETSFWEVGLVPLRISCEFLQYGSLRLGRSLVTLDESSNRN